MPVPRVLAPKYWGFHLLALVLVAIAVGLGLWQYAAWGERRDHEAQDLTQVEPEPLQEVMGPDDPFMGDSVGRPVVVEGSWVDDSTIFVSNREQDDKDGYWVVTPVAVDKPGDPAILVVRGWTPAIADAPEAPTGETTLVGLLQPAEGSTNVVDDDPTDDVLPQLRLADAIQFIDQDLYGGYVVAGDPAGGAAGDAGSPATTDNDGTEGLAHADVDQLPEVGQFTALRNLLYAIEWWIFGLFAGFIWWRWMRDETMRGVDSQA
ncbi:MAG: SURF1 family protein [Nocardioides sp.]|nr:SURF1 family protein [Nocardioides sp.]